MMQWYDKRKQDNASQLDLGLMEISFSNCKVAGVYQKKHKNIILVVLSHDLLL